MNHDHFDKDRFVIFFGINSVIVSFIPANLKRMVEFSRVPNGLCTSIKQVIISCGFRFY